VRLAIAVSMSLVACAAPVAPARVDLSATVEKTMLRGTWSHRVIVLGTVEGPAVAAGAERREDVRLVIDENYLLASTLESDETVLALRILSHFGEDGTRRLSPQSGECATFECPLICESEGGEPCARWYEQPRMRVDARADLVGALPIPGIVEPIDCFADCDSPAAPSVASDGALTWDLTESYLVSTCDVPAMCSSVVRARHELRRID
jgi:hypothetical protein